MGQLIEVPGYGQVEFPDGMSDSDIASAIKKNMMNAPSKGLELAQGVRDAVKVSSQSPTPSYAGMMKFATGALGAPVDAIQAAANIPPELVKSGLMARGRYDLANKVPTLKGSVGGSEWLQNLLRKTGVPLLSPDNPTSQNASGSAQYDLTARGGFIPGGVLPALGSMAAEKLLGPDWGGVGMLAPQAGVMGYNALRAPGLQAQQQMNALRDETLRKAREEGYRVPPSAADGNFLTDRLESIAGKAATAQQATVQNQQATNAIARREAGLPENQAISVQALEARRDALAAPYDEIRQLSGTGPLSKPPFKNPADTLAELKQVRADANAQWKFYDRNADPATLQEAQRLSARSAQLEAQLEAVATASGRPGLVDELRAARRDIAKTFDIERALNVATGDVSAPTLGRMADKGKLSGGLETAGKFQQAFPRYAREGEVQPPPGVSKSEALVALLAGLGGHAAIGPYGWALAAAPLVSGPTRAALLSGPAQKAFAPSYGPALSPAPTPQLLYQLGILNQQ